MYRVLTIGVVLMLSACGNTSNEDRKIGTEAVDIPYSADDKKGKSKQPEITFEFAEVEVGRILQGDERTIRFPFVNSGKSALIISDVSASCGCTVARNYPKGKIMPGEGGAIEVAYDTSNSWGDQVSVIAVSTNTTKSRTELIIRAHVVAPNKQQQQQQQQ